MDSYKAESVYTSKTSAWKGMSDDHEAPQLLLKREDHLELFSQDHLHLLFKFTYQHTSYFFLNTFNFSTL